MSIFKKITYNIKHNKKDKPILNKYEEDEFQEATECYICGKEFEENNKVREHDHLSGKYRGAACQSCNTKEGKATKLIPVFFHNGSNYDFHFLIEELMKKEDKYNKVQIIYMDGLCQKNYQQKDFKWEEDPDYYKKVPKGRGCLIKCDLKYTDKCKKKTIKYPLAPEKTRPRKEELSNYQLNLLGNKPLESDWLAKYINFNTEQRTKSKSDFEKDLWKLMNNSFYGKTLEDIRGRSEIKLLTDREEVKNI
ncbi:unnamed protein product [Mytilus coruscus]|uniref:C2H2-type domain-containing protein n=1 Tax=Mytilus coruscus TaxID=42192 RepID=A0A6J8B5W2_MYTCO|nr:unnamed protein product [Mytilus coruscus]